MVHPSESVRMDCTDQLGFRYKIDINKSSCIKNTSCRLGNKGRFLMMISIPKIDFSLKINISLHNCDSKKTCSIRYDANLYHLSWKSRKHLYLRPQNRTRSRPPKAADFFGCFFVFCTDVSWTSKINDID